MRKILFLFLMCWASVYPKEEAKGLFSFRKMDEGLDIIALFLPYNPRICLMGNEAEAHEKCALLWPHAQIVHACDEKIDFLWINGESDVKGVGKDSHLRAVYYENSRGYESERVKKILLKQGQVLCTEWRNDKQAKTFFLRQDIYNGFVKSLQFSPEKGVSLSDFSRGIPERFLLKVEHKEGNHSMPGIEFIYMINLDERPEKFKICSSALEEYGIYPYRFSAVNGWKLSNDVLNEVGVKFCKGMRGEEFLGAIFCEVEGREYRNLDFIREEGRTYFCPGITRGAIGIVLSHVSILKDAYDAGYQTIWVMEDDIQIHEDPRQLSWLIQELDRFDPAWDIFFTDIDSKDQAGAYVPCRALGMRPDVEIGPLSSFVEKCTRVNGTFSTTGMRYGAYSMILRRSGVEKILNYYRQHAIFLPYDADYWLNSSLRMYCVNRDIVSTIPNALSDNNRPSYKN